MSRDLRKKPRISYAEFEEPSPDEYVFCAECGDYVYEYCTIHGALLVVSDDKVPSKSPYPPIVPRAALTIPHVFLHLAPSIIPGAGLGVFATLTLPSGVRFGPYRGQRADDVSSSYCWQMYDRHGRRAHVIDAADARSSNWMRYVNCSRHWCEQNLVAFQYRGQLYYRTIKIIPRFTELMVFYGAEFAHRLGVDIRAYNSPPEYARKYGAPAKKSAKATDKKVHTEATSKQIAPKLNQTETAGCDTDKENQQKREEKTEEPKAKTPKKSTNKKFIPPLKKNNVILNEPNNNKKIEVLKSSNDAQTNNVMSAPVAKKAEYVQPITTITPKYIDANKLEPNTEHINVQVGENLLQSDLLCEICSYEIKSKKSLEKHLILHTQDKNILKCSHCGYMSKNKFHLIRHVKTHTGDKPFACKVCDYKCIESGHMKRHMKTHTGEKPFACKVCDYKFTRSGTLKDHMKTHTGEKPFACKVCDYKCTRSGTLKRHIKTHTGEKLFACKVCDYKCAQSGNLKNHMKTHTGEKLFACKVCDYKCTRSGNLKDHMKTHTGEKPFACKVCDYKCAQSGTLKKHIRTHTGEKPFACRVCDYRSTCSNHISRNMRARHSGETQH